MARNRKSQSAAIRFGPALKAVLLCLLIGGSGVGYVWQKDQILRLGEIKKARESRLLLLKEQNAKLRKQLAILRSPKELQDRALKLGMVPTQQAQLWVLSEPLAEPQRPPGTAECLARTETRPPR